jgi:hypothetical protein
VAASGLGGFAHHDKGYLPRVKRWLLNHEMRDPEMGERGRERRA